MHSPYEACIRSLSARPVQHVQVGGCPSMVRVFFAEGSIERPLDPGLRLFLITLQHVTMHRADSVVDAIPSPLGYFQLLGYQTGDTAVFERDGQRLTIQFS